MKKININQVSAGSFTAKPIYVNDELLLDKESFLNENLIEGLKKRNIEEIWIKENRELNDYERQICLENSYTKLLNNTIMLLKQAGADENIDVSAIGLSVKEIIDSINYDSNILLNLINLKEESDYLFTHSVNVAVLSMMMGVTLKMSEKDLKILGTGALLHDIGLMEIPSEIRNNQNTLNKSETELLQSHPSLGASRLMDYDDINVESINIIYQHHERCDGSGYPEKLLGSQISNMAKIVSIADSYEAMTHDRAYRKKYSGYQALKTLLPLSATLYDPYYLQVFLKFMPIFPVGSLVLLNNNAVGKVMGASANVFRPIVEMVYNNSGKAFLKSEKIDLSETKNSLIYISRVMTMDEVINFAIPSDNNDYKKDF